ncbi:MAG TPA: hypothetical protein VIC57_18240 [Candidatus Dormibacteraeota bacterium]
MPPIPPDPGPTTVQFDQQRAQDAIDALTAAARVLQQHVTTDLGNAKTALDGWTGHHADTFTSGDLPWIRSESTRLIDGMLKLAGQIGQAAADARTLQRQLDQARKDPHPVGGHAVPR